MGKSDILKINKVKIFGLIILIIVLIGISIFGAIKIFNVYQSQPQKTDDTLLRLAEKIKDVSSEEIKTESSTPAESSSELPKPTQNTPSSIKVQSKTTFTYKGYEFTDVKSVWGNMATLQDHFDRHGKDFAVNNSQEYAFLSNIFFKERKKYQIKTDDTGVIRVFDAQNNYFGSYNKDGTTKTFFKATGGQKYFDSQPGN